MKKLISALTLALMAACPLAVFGDGSLENDPAYLQIEKALDLKSIHPEVNINIPRFLLKDAASELNGGPGDPLAGTGIDFADLVKDVKLIRVVVIDAKKTNRSALEKGVKTLKADLEAKWTPIVSVPESNVGVYAMGDPSGETMAGIALLVYDDGNAVIANVVGRVSIGKLIKIASRMDKLPKDMLEKLRAVGNESGNAASQPASKDTSSDKKPAETPDKTSPKPGTN